MRSIVEAGSNVPAFLGKLWKLVNDSETDHLISWSPGGKTFFIKNQAEFARSLLPLYYKHNNMASFIRQLNMYGFHKITSVENGGLRYEKDEIEFCHPCFMKGYAYLLEHIKRKIANPKIAVSSSEASKILVKPEIMSKMLADVKQMKGKQESMDAKFSVMKQENEALWREVAVLRQKHIKQQQIVNNLIQFLMSLVQPSRSGNMNSHGVKRRYQLMINDAAHNLRFDQSPAKNPKLEADLMEDLNEEVVEDGPTIHELAHDDMVQTDEAPSPIDPSNYVTIEIPNISPELRPGSSSNTPHQYHVTLGEAEDPGNGVQLVSPYQMNSNEQLITTPSSSPVVTSPSPDPNFPYVLSPTATGSSTRQDPGRSQMLSPSQFIISPAPDMRLPADIFASDDSVGEPGTVLPEAAPPPIDSLVSTDVVLNTNDALNAYNSLFVNPHNVKIEKNIDTCKRADKKRISNAVAKTNPVCNAAAVSNVNALPNANAGSNVNVANIKTELLDSNVDDNMTLATVNNNGNINCVQSMSELDDHLDTMQSDIESLRELLRGDSYSFDANTLLGVSNANMGLFGQDDAFYGLNFNSMDDRTKTNPNGQEPNQLMSYTGNVPDFGDFSLPEDAEASQDEVLTDTLLSDASALNTPQVTLNSPFHLPAARK